MEPLNSVSSEHFQSSELACEHCGVNACKQELVDALEELRGIVGVPIVIDDAYRCPVHNAEVFGVSNSEHTQGIAADIKIEGMTPAEMYKAALKVPAFRGIGVAEHQGYIHVDTRTVEARWCYSVSGAPSAWDRSLDA
jgi:uncharacterized protein YcbK (DUF882 family)